MNLFKKRFKTILYFYCIGFVITSIPHTLNILENRKIARLQFLEKKFVKNQQEKMCKEKTNFTKLYEMGFKETAQKRLILCMKQLNS